MNNKITKKIIVLGIIAFCFIFTNTTLAYSCLGYSCTNYDYQNRNDNNYYSQYDYSRQVVPVEYVANSQPNSSVVNNYYYQKETTPKNTTVTNKETNLFNSTENDSSTNDKQQTEDDYYRNNLGASAYNSYGQSNGKNITALSLRGSGGFMPSSIWQWILVVILILIIVIIGRMFVRKPHPSDHDAHGSHAH